MCNVKKGAFLDNKFHPYAGIVRIKLEGIISARTIEHPLNFNRIYDSE